MQKTLIHNYNGSSIYQKHVLNAKKIHPYIRWIKKSFIHNEDECLHSFAHLHF